MITFIVALKKYFRSCTDSSQINQNTEEKKSFGLKLKFLR